MRSECVWIPETAWTEMIAEAERCAPIETGGCLMGYRIADTHETVVVHVIGPGPCPQADPTTFEPDYEYQQTEIQRLYDESGRRHTYLGDWHSHPVGSTALSRRDRRALGVIARTKEARQPYPLMAIVAGGDPWKLCIWRYTPGLLWARLRRAAATFY